MTEMFIAWAIVQTGLLLLIARELHNINRRARAREAAKAQAQKLAASLKPFSVESFDDTWNRLQARSPKQPD